MAASGPANGWRARAPDGVALGLLALATAGFFWRILFAGDWMPAGGGDLAALLYPTYHFAAQALKSGTLPLWNPYLWGGAPFAADIQASFFYPINLLYFALAPEITYRGVMLLAVFHIWLAGAGMYLFLKSLLPAPATRRLCWGRWPSCSPIISSSTSAISTSSRRQPGCLSFSSSITVRWPSGDRG